jgi:hypothetical protein
MRPALQYWHLKAGLTRDSPISNRKLADPGDLRLLRLNESRVLRKEANKSATTWFSHPPRIGKIKSQRSLHDIMIRPS